MTCGLGYDWRSLKEGSIVVDVGGSVGAVSRTILEENTHLRFVVQDLKSVVENDAPKVRVVLE